MAVFIDYENMVLCAREDHLDFSIDPIMEVLRARGRPVLVRAYGDWGTYPQYPRDLRAHAVDLVQLYRYGVQQKNRADIALAVQAMDAAYRLPHIEVFVVVAGDGDYAPLASMLRVLGKRVMGVGIRGSTSPLLVSSCDEFLYYDTLIAQAALPLEPLDVLDLTEKALRALQQLGETAVTAERLRQVMIGLDPTFVASSFIQHHGSLEAFLGTYPDRVQVDREDGMPRYSLPAGQAQDASERGKPGVAPVGNGQVETIATPPRPPRRSLQVRYRQALLDQGWSLLNPDDRRAVLRSLYETLHESPGGRSMSDVVQNIAERYERLQMTVTRAGVEEAARSAWLAQVILPVDSDKRVGGTAVLRPSLSQEEFVAECERVYLLAMRDGTGQIEPEAAAQALFGDARRTADVQELLATLDLARTLPALPHPSLRELIGTRAYELLGQAIETPPPPGTAVNAQEARLVFEKGQEQRSRDFVTGGRTLLLASQIEWHALRQGDFSANPDNLRWYVASALSAEAGARYSTRDYEAAIPYYLAYFSMLRRGDRLWDDVSRLTIHMLSYFTILATRLEGERDPILPSAGQPGYLVAMVATHENHRVIWRWEQLARSMAEASPAVAEELLRRVEDSSADPETIRQTVQWMRDLAVSG
jgi:hypothetical protein